MANYDIIILASVPNALHPGESSLTLSSDDLVVKPGDIITWKIKSGIGITSILIADDSHIDVFGPDPAPVTGSTDWQGTINSGIKKKCSENYSIYWSEGGVVYSYDPKIKVNP